MNLGFSRRNVVRPVSQKSRRRRPLIKRRQLLFDCLEDRRLLSGGSLTIPGNSVTVDNSGTATLAFDSPQAVAMDTAGDAVVAWGDRNPTTGTWNLMFERYTNSSGMLTPQGAVTVASNVPSSNLDGAVIMVARAPTNGDFVVVWGTATTPTKKDSSGTYATHAQLYDAAGGPIGSSFLVGGGGNDLPKSVAMNDSGFDVLYGAYGSRLTNGYVLTVQRYGYTSGSDSAVGKPISVVTPGWDDGGNGGTSMAMDSNGNFVVGWKDWTNNNTTNTQYIDAELFTSAGSGQGVIQVASANAAQNQGVGYGDIAMDSAGTFAVDWKYQTSLNTLEVRQFTTGGIAVQSEANPIIVARTQLDSSGHATSGPSSGGALAETGGGAFDISWTNAAYPGQSSIDAATYDASGNQLQMLNVTSLTSLAQSAPSVAVDGKNDLFVVWQQQLVANSQVGNVVGEFYLDPPAPAATPSTSTSLSSSGVTSPSGSTTAATDAVFAAYTYPGDDDTLG